jgi:PAS domain S-box-containing protein
MNKKQEIDKIFKKIDTSWKSLLEVFPVGILLFDKKFRIKSINNNFTELIKSQLSINVLIGKYLLDDSLFELELPLVEFLEIINGKSFEQKILTKTIGKRTFSVIIKGTPIYDGRTIVGGSLIVEDFQVSSDEEREDLAVFNTFENFIKNLCDCYLIIEPDGTIQYASNSRIPNCEFLNNSDNKNIIEIFNNSSENKIKSVITKVLTEKTNQYAQLNYYSVITKVTLNSIFIPLTANNEEISSIIVLLKEYSEESEDGISIFDNTNELKEYFSLAVASSDGIFKTNLHGNITFWTQKAEELFEITEDNIKSKFINKIFPQIDEVYFDKVRNDLLLNKKWEKKLKFVKKNRTLWLNVKIVFIPNNNSLIFYCNVVDENQQKIEYAKEEERKFFKEAVLKSDEMILQLDAFGTISFVNEKFRNRLGYNIDEISGIAFTDLIDVKYKIENKISEMSSLVRNRAVEIIPLTAKSGKHIEVCVDFNITHDGSTLRYYTVFLKECSKEKKLHSQIAETLLNESKDAIIVLVKDKILKTNEQFIELFGFENDTEILNKNLFEILKVNKPKDLESILSGEKDNIVLNVKRNSKKEFEVEVKRLNSHSKENTSILVFKPTNKQLLVLPKEMNYLENLTSNLNEFLWSAKIINDELNIEFVSPGISKVTGYSQMEFIAKPTFWNNIIHPDDVEKVRKTISDLLQNKKANLTEIIYRIIKKDGNTIWLDTKVKVVRDKDGNVTEIFGSSSDITEKEKENEKLKEELNKLKDENKTKDKFISIISHDLRSPFTSILGFTELIATDNTLEKEEIREYVANIQEASKNTLSLVNSLLDWTRLQTGRIDIVPEVINASYLVKKTLLILSGAAMQKGLSLTSHVDESIYITADENILSQVFNNLVSNAIKFTPKGGSIDIYANKIEGQQKVQFIVKDTGVGVEEKDIPKLFLVDKKFTTLGTDGERGTGLGLSLVKEIITKHNGDIHVKSEIGKGTEFIFTIPISSPSILVVDSVQSERILYSKLIRSITNGIDVYKAESEKLALDLIKEKMPMVIVTEHKLSNTYGFEFIEKIKSSEIKYKPNIIVLSRNIDDETTNKYQKLGIENIFTKPVDLKEFKTTLDKIIGKN